MSHYVSGVLKRANVICMFAFFLNRSADVAIYIIQIMLSKIKKYTERFLPLSVATLYTGLCYQYPYLILKSHIAFLLFTGIFLHLMFYDNIAYNYKAITHAGFKKLYTYPKLKNKFFRYLRIPLMIKKRRQLKLAKCYLKIINIRKDYLHKITNQISNENQIICLEDLAVSNMLKNHKLAQAISDVSWHEFKRQLEYKCKWKGRQLVIIDRFFPSSKTCDTCGTINQSLTLKDREWICNNCNTHHLRDHLASRNILRQGLNIAAGMVVKSDGSCCQ